MIDTAGWNLGTYSIKATVTDTDGIEHSDTASLNLEPGKISLALTKAVREDDEIKIYGTAEFEGEGAYELRYYDDSIASWRRITSSAKEVKDGLLGSVSVSEYPYSEIFIDLIAITEDGYRKSISDNLTVEIPTPTPTVTPTGTPTTTPTVTPTPTPIVFTEDELFVDIASG